MDITIRAHNFCENNLSVKIPASKSHTIRMLLIAALSDGVSQIEQPLISGDAKSALNVCRALGANILETVATDKNGNQFIERWTVKGIGGAKNIKEQTVPLDVQNSGTTLFLAIAICSLSDHRIEFTGDHQIAKRSAKPLLDALLGLGVSVTSNNGCVPITVKGPWKSARVSIECPTSQYLSALLLSAPLASADCYTQIDVPLLNEKPYIEMTLSYLCQQGISYFAGDNQNGSSKNSCAEKDFSSFAIHGGAQYKPLSAFVPSDFSSAAFPSLAAVISASVYGGNFSKTELLGLDYNDFQGDKIFFDILKQCGASVEWGEKKVTVGGGELHGAVFDLNDTPDLLPVCAVLAAYCSGETRLINVAHARIKETDRIKVMCSELKKLGVDIAELPDGLVIKGGNKITGGTVDGHGDHRVVMALSVCALGATAPVTILGAEAADVTYPEFLGLIKMPNRSIALFAKYNLQACCIQT